MIIPTMVSCTEVPRIEKHDPELERGLGGSGAFGIGV